MRNWSNGMSERNTGLDLMRVLGIFLIMIAHAEPPAWFDQLRNFGTPLLIVASGATYAFIYRTRTLKALPFLRKRLSRLIFPAWIFLTFFFLFFYCAAVVLGKDYPFDFRTVATSFTFYSGIGYAWILNIYLLLALITPAALYLKKAGASNLFYFSMIVIVYCIYELLLRASGPYISGPLVELTGRVIFAIVPYSLLYLYGFKLEELSNRQVAIAGIVALFIFACIAVDFELASGAFVPTQKFKYPPSIYYLSYAFFALNAVFLVCRNYFNGRNSAVILWLSSHSLWIYLWHILAIYLVKYSIGTDNHGFFVSLFRAVILLGFGVCLTWLQILCVEKLLARFQSPALRKISTVLV